MKDVKYKFEDYLLFDYASLEEHLAEMAAKGWRLERPGSCFWKFRRAEPANLTYAVNYVPDASDFNPHPTNGQQTLQDFCEEAGWEKVADWFQMQIFVIEQENPVPMETEEAVRLQVIQKSMRKNFLPSHIILLVMAVILFGMQSSLVLGGSSQYSTFSTHLTAACMMLVLMVMVFTNLISYGIWCSRSEKLLEQGKGCARISAYRKVGKISLAVMIALLLAWFVGYMRKGSIGVVSYAVAYGGIIALLVVMMRTVQRSFRKLGMPKWLNITLTFLCNFIAAVVFVGMLSYVAFRYGWFF